MRYTDSALRASAFRYLVPLSFCRPHSVGSHSLEECFRLDGETQKNSYSDIASFILEFVYWVARSHYTAFFSAERWDYSNADSTLPVNNMESECGERKISHFRTVLSSFPVRKLQLPIQLGLFRFYLRTLVLFSRFVGFLHRKSIVSTLIKTSNGIVGVLRLVACFKCLLPQKLILLLTLNLKINQSESH